MPSTPPSHRSPAAPASRSILARIAQPFQPKPRNLTDFHIQTEEPYRQYGPGDCVKGSVLVTALKPVRITHIVLSLHGYVKVYRGGNIRADGPSKDAGVLSPGRGTRGPEFIRNGLATIFEDEVVLCGEGRLIPNIYSFKFALPFPNRSMPTSIEFERGSIAYMITATLTRPTTISPTMSCERDIPFSECLDVAAFSKPKPRVIVLEPVARRVKTKQPRRHRTLHSQVRHDEASLQPANSQSATPPIASTPHEESTSIRRNSIGPMDVPSSPAYSVGDSASVQSSANASFRVVTMSTRIDEHIKASERADKTVVATVDMLRGACLPGDVIPIKIIVDHTREVRALEGIIVTLYRSARLDRQPLVPIGDAKCKSSSQDECYSRSRTGLSGLSLSSADSTHTFRLDLAQTFAPLIVDPTTLTAVVKTSIQIPDDVFPTISCCPGAMITFKYFVEVVVDIRGKYASADRILPRLTMTGAPSTYAHEPPFFPYSEATLARSDQARNRPLRDVGQMRRDRNVISCLFELVIGTKDSQRQVSQRRARTFDDLTREPSEASVVDPGLEYGDLEYDDFSMHGYEYDETLATGHGNALTTELSDMDLASYHEPPGPTLDLPPPPEPTDEKSRIRQAEQRLLPSAPPVDDEDPEPELMALATAPSLNELGEFPYAGTSAPAYAGQFLHRPSHEHASGSQTATSAQDDKQEMERQRLLAAASSPDDDHDGEDEQTAGPSIVVPLPTAPVLNEDDEDQADLPRYMT